MSKSNVRPYKICVSKQELSVLPAARYKGNIVLIDNASQVDEAISKLRKSDVIGFDTETRPSFKKGQTHNVSLMQLSTRDTCYLFRLNHIGMPQALKNLLEDASQPKIGLSIHDDFHNLNKICDLSPDGFLDLQEYVKKWNFGDISLTKIYAIVFGQRISKGQRLTNWEAETLSPHQQSYASLDALACIQIFDYLESGQFNPLESRFLHYLDEELTDAPCTTDHNKS